jgi:hypothetical protein
VDRERPGALPVGNGAQEIRNRHGVTERRGQATAGAGLGPVRDTILTLFLSRETGLFNGLRWTRGRKKILAVLCD